MKQLMIVAVILLGLTGLKVFGAGCEPSDGPSLCEDKSVHVSPLARREAREFQRDVEQGRLTQRANVALDAMIRFAVFKLKKTGHKDKADQLLKEWESGWNQALLMKDLGSHAPLSAWLAEKYAMIEFLLGVDVCHMLRLDDIKIINYGIPVVFSCIDNVDVDEYGRHFIPFSGTVVYWSSFFLCVGGTWGTGFLFCSPISWGAEFLTEKWVAPALNPKVWGWACGGSYAVRAF